MRTMLIAVLALLGSLVGALAFTPAPALAAGCQFVLGFKTLHDLIPTVVGDCRTDERHDQRGDAFQETTRGTLVWRKANNQTSFTDGQHVWTMTTSGIKEQPVHLGNGNPGNNPRNKSKAGRVPPGLARKLAGSAAGRLPPGLAKKVTGSPPGLANAGKRHGPPPWAGQSGEEDN